MNKQDTIVALSTPSAESAVAMIRLSGDKCPMLASECFGKEISSIEARRAYFAKYISTEKDVLDEVVFILYKAPHSYTGEDMLEISCHGNPFIIQNIIGDLIRRGARAAEGGEFTRRAFCNDKMDLSQAEAVSLLIGARSSRSLKAAQMQLDGELGRRIGSFSQKLLDICALLEAYIDFPEEEIEKRSSDEISKNLDKLSGDIRSLASTSKYSALVHGGINIVIAGAPNAGKSSLLNALLGSERAIVDSRAGTTRDYIREQAVFGPHRVNITDTAGLRNAKDNIESRGVELAEEKIKSADMLFFVVDSSCQPPEPPKWLKENFGAKNTILVLNKADLPQDASICNFMPECRRVKVSCLNTEGIDALKDEAISLINEHHLRAAADDILVSARHARILEEAASLIESASAALKDNRPIEFVSSDLKEALYSLGAIVGKIDCENILDKIFSNFCIGK